MRNVTRLKTRKDRLREDQAEQVRQALLPFLSNPDFDQDALGRVIITVNRLTIPEPSWKLFKGERYEPTCRTGRNRCSAQQGKM